MLTTGVKSVRKMAFPIIRTEKGMENWAPHLTHEESPVKWNNQTENTFKRISEYKKVSGRSAYV